MLTLMQQHGHSCIWHVAQASQLPVLPPSLAEHAEKLARSMCRDLLSNVVSNNLQSFERSIRSRPDEEMYMFEVQPEAGLCT